MVNTAKIMLFALLMVSASGLMYPITDVSITRSVVVATLYREDCALIDEFNTFCKKYDDAVCRFFDKKNNQSLAVHIEYMERELQLLKNVSDDRRYKSVRPILVDYHAQIAELIRVLKHYIGSHNIISLGLRVRKFKFLLPESVQQRGKLSLLSALHHRLISQQ